MPTSRSRSQAKHLESINTLAFADARMVELFVMNCKGMRNPRLVGPGRMRESVNDPLDPARGIFNGLRASFMLWGFISLVFMLTR